MRLCAAALLIAACGDDPSLRVSVEHPADARLTDLIASTTITIYEGALTCSEVELGDVHGAELDAFMTTQVTLQGDASRGSFDGVSRLDHKVIVARGFDEGGALITAGCAELDEIVEGSSVEITTIAAATVSLGAAEDGSRGVLVTASDPTSRPIDGRTVSWRLYGAAGTSADGARFTNVADGIWEPKAPTCTRNGAAIVHPAPPKVPGGFAVQARVSWAAERPPLFTQFTKLDVLSTATLFNSAVQTCAVKTAGTPAVICMESATALAEYRVTGSTLSRVQLPAIEAAVALVSNVENNQRHVYAITEAGKWIAVSGAPATKPQQLWCTDPLCRTLDVQIAPACGDDPAIIVAQVGTVVMSTFVEMDVKGGPVRTFRGTPMATAILNAGCLAELQTDGTAINRQAVAVESPVGASGATAIRVLFDCTGRPDGCANLLVGEGVGFTTSAGGEARMIVSDFDATGAVLSTVVARPSDDGASFVQRARQPAAAPPLQIIPARLDDDAELDLMWHFAIGQAGRASSIQVAYAREVEGSPLTALFPTGARVVELLSGDLNGDDFDEAMFVIDTATQGRRLAIIPVGRPYNADAIPNDAPCP